MREMATERRTVTGIGPSLLAALGLLWLGGCSSGTGPAERGRVAAVFLDDPSVITALFAPPSPYWLAHHKNFGGNYFHGELDARVELLLSKDGESFVTLGAPAPLRVALQDPDVRSPFGAPASVPAGTYAYVRLVLHSATVVLWSGSRIGAVDLPRDAALTLAEGADAIIDRRLTIPLRVLAGAGVTLTLDFNSEAWVTEDNLLKADVTEPEVAGALTISVLPAAGLSLAIPL
ncbi:MAG: hypothetical protein ACE5HQ_07450 [Gemmatimonadota bacterium]